MAAISTLHSRRATMKLNNGTSAGKILVVSVALATLAATSGSEASITDSILNVCDSAETCLAKEIVRVEYNLTSYLTRS